MQTPSDCWQRAAFYWEKFRTASDSHLRRQYLDLAARYLELGQKFEETETSTAAPETRPRSK